MDFAVCRRDDQIVLAIVVEVGKTRGGRAVALEVDREAAEEGRVVMEIEVLGADAGQRPAIDVRKSCSAGIFRGHLKLDDDAELVRELPVLVVTAPSGRVDRRAARGAGWPIRSSQGCRYRDRVNSR